MAQLTPKRAHALAKAALQRKLAWHSVHSEVFDLAFPNRADGGVPGQRMATKIWDGTAPASVQRGASRMMEFTPAGGAFLVLEPGPFVEMILPAEEHGKLREKLASAAALCNSSILVGGFFSATHEMWQDWFVGIGGMIVNEASHTDPSAIARFQSVPMSQFMVEEGPGGQITRRYRWWLLAGERIMQDWPDATLPDTLARAIKEKPDDKVKLVEIEYLDPDGGEEPWRYEIFEDKQGGSRLVERTGATSIWLTPRHTKRAGEEIGRGPLVTSLPDIRTANKVVELVFRAVALNLLGIYMAQEDAVNPNVVELVPGGIIPVRRTGGPNGPALVRLDTGNFRPDFAAIVLDDVRLNIKRALMDNALPSDAGPVRSATEIAARMRELALDMPAAYGRLMDEFIVPLTQRLLDILHRRGLLPDKLRVDQFLVKVSVSSPVAREQNLGELERLVQWLEILQAVGGRELVLLGSMIEDVPEKMAQLLGVDPKLVRPATGKGGRIEMQKNMAKVAGAQQAGAQGPVQVQEAVPVALAA